MSLPNSNSPRDRKFAADAAEALRLTATDLFKFGIVDSVIPEPLGGAHTAPAEAADSLKMAVVAQLESLAGSSPEKLRAERYAKFRKFGQFTELEAA